MIAFFLTKSLNRKYFTKECNWENSHCTFENIRGEEGGSEKKVRERGNQLDFVSIAKNYYPL